MAWRPIAAPMTTFVSSDDALAYYRRRCDAVARLAEAELRAALRAADTQCLEVDQGFWPTRFPRPANRPLE